MFSESKQPGARVIVRAQEEARRAGQNLVGTEHTLLGLIAEDGTIAGRALKAMGANLQDARTEVQKVIGLGSEFVSLEIPFTSRAKRVLELSWHEARELADNYIGPEHLLLGIIREGECVAARVLENLGVSLEKLRAEVLSEIKSER